MRKSLLVGLFLWTTLFAQISPVDVVGARNAIFNNQQAVTSTPTALATQVLKTICIKAMHANTTSVFIGNSGVTTANGMELIADQSWCANINNANLVWIVGTSGANVSWIGTN